MKGFPHEAREPAKHGQEPRNDLGLSKALIQSSLRISGLWLKLPVKRAGPAQSPKLMASVGLNRRSVLQPFVHSARVCR